MSGESAPVTVRAIRAFDRAELEAFVSDNLELLSEDEAVACLENPFAGPKICGAMARTARLTGIYAVTRRLVAHRQTPQAHAVKLVHYLHWVDLLRLSTDVRVPAPVRRAIDGVLMARVSKLTTGEKVASARICGTALIEALIVDPHPRVFEALLPNRRLREDDLLALISSRRASREQLQMIADDPRWSFRRAVRLALVLNPDTPRAAAASQLRHLSKRERERVRNNPSISLYLKRCIERLESTGAAGEGDEVSGIVPC
jgi:hypothetical protein